MRYSRQLVGDVSTTVRAVVRQGKQVMSRGQVDSVVVIASVHLCAAVGAVIGSKPKDRRYATALLSLLNTVMCSFAGAKGTHKPRSFVELSIYPSGLVGFNPPPMPHGFCVDGGKTGNIIAINHAAKVVIRKFYQFAPADQAIHF